ncbi:MAG: hypothetical protein CBC47_01645 [Alphaproteobacteria bacterium TMED87]|nr:hypothetical protein [Rhodospirillaceae bacterium]OUV11226.1 MAG: hypothetical protein CBC47_01645 [Alphaproteobacteria bacterium TMED87]|tara:strand:- start:2156 stop:2491 length:336 start_codon:yes stop_codon:yes gene_type:complete
MHLKLNGQVNGDLLIQEETVFLGGSVTGDIEAAKIVVQEKCEFDGRLVADALVIMGHVKGECVSNEIYLKDKSVTEATLHSNDVKIEIGAQLGGSIKNLDNANGLDKSIKK